MARDAALSDRLTYIDAFRGLTVAGMLLVNDPGDASTVFWPLKHADWNGWTPTDLVFPFFLFVVGITTQLSLARRTAAGADAAALRRQVLRRAALLFGIGLVLNWYPFYQSGDVEGNRFVARLLHLRIPGVLQRIALAYLGGALLSWRASTRRIVATVAVLLLGYWALLGIGNPLGDKTNNLPAIVDRAVLDWSRFGLGNHLWDGGVVYDPEGLLSTIPAIGTVLLGVLAGRWLTARRGLGALAIAGVLGTVAGLAWGLVLPINKALWTPSYVLLSAGLACLVLCAIAWLRVEGPLIVYGSNPIIAFVGAELLAKILHSSIKWRVDGHRVGTEVACTLLLTSTGLDPRVASLAWAVLFVLLWYVILRRLHHRGILVAV